MNVIYDHGGSPFEAGKSVVSDEEHPARAIIKSYGVDRDSTLVFINAKAPKIEEDSTGLKFCLETATAAINIVLRLVK